MVEVTFHSTGRDFCPDNEHSFIQKSITCSIHTVGGALFSGHSAMTEAISQIIFVANTFSFVQKLTEKLLKKKHSWNATVHAYLYTVVSNQPTLTTL